MATINKSAITVDVDVKMHIDTDTAYKALTIIDIWLGENPGRRLEARQSTDGTWITNLFSADDECGIQKEGST